MKMINKIKELYKKKNKPKVVKLPEDDLAILKELSSISKPEEIAMAMDLSISRVNYEIKQLQNKV